MFANGLEWPHLLIILGAFILLFGAKKLPEAAQSLGKSLKVFKKEMSDLRDSPADTTAAAPPARRDAPTPTDKQDAPHGQPD